MSVLVVGAGLSGAVIARELAEAGHTVRVIEGRPVIGGNCYTERDAETGVMMHVHGPHIFHTDDDETWDYVNRFAEFLPIRCQVRATVGGAVYSLPVNLHTINQFFGRAMGPGEARAFVAERSRGTMEEARSFEDVALASIGPELYHAFFHGYPIKQWGRDPSRIPASVLKRLPVRFDYDDNYFHHRRQAAPREGYTAFIEAILDHPSITVELSRPYRPTDRDGHDHTFYCGGLDGFFGYRHGDLSYRTLEFEVTRHAESYQGCAVMSYPSADVPFTRVSEHNYLSPWDETTGTVVFREYSRDARRDDTLYYPLRLVDDKETLARYVDLAEGESGVTFAGRLGTYRYLDMDVCVAEARRTAAAHVAALAEGAAPPAFAVRPL